MTAGEAAWPFLVSRSRTEDHRLIVIPEFMTDPPMISALRASVGDEPTEPGSAMLREIAGPEGSVVTVVYRVFLARGEDYEIPGSGVLTDEHSRQILVSEGLVLRRAAADVLRSGVVPEAMDEAHALVAAGFREFWSAKHPFIRQEAHAFPVPSRDSPGLHLQYKSPVPPPTTSMPSQFAPEAGEPEAEPPHRGPRSRASVLVTVAVTSVVALLAVAGASLLAVKILSHHTPSPTSRNAAETMAAFCSDLRAGHGGAAYSLTTAHYRERTSEHSFVSELLTQGSVAAKCTYSLRKPHGSTADATMTVTQRKASQGWVIALTGAAGTPWQITGISQAKHAGGRHGTSATETPATSAPHSSPSPPPSAASAE
jgi:hypothetical protein